MKTMKLVNISSEQYDKAEATAFFHAVAAPVLVAIFSHLIGLDSIITALAYTLLMSAINLHRSFSNDAFSEEKSNMYFEYLKYLFVLFFIIALYALLGGRHV